MKKILFGTLLLLLISCNADILMTNGEITKPDKGSSSTTETVEFSTDAPTGLNATKSYYSDYISLRWDSVAGADYYTIEKAVKSESTAATDEDVWTEVGETITKTSYKDKASLSANKYYNYRVTAHTYEGLSGNTSDVAVGTILASPEELSATKGTSETTIILNWTQMPYVDSYEIYKSENSSITGLKSELLDTVSADDANTVIYYSYLINQDKEKGKELYFSIIGVAPTGEKATISVSRSGYTLVPGSPGKPEVSVTKGSSHSSILVYFKSSGSNSDKYKYVIKRSYKGSAEQIVFSTEFTAITELETEDGYYIFEDTDVKENVEYTYTITAENDIGISEAGYDYGYIVSTVSSLSLVADKNKFGYNITYTLPVGALDENRTTEYTYHVTRTRKDGTVLDTEDYTEKEFASFNSFISVEKNITDDSSEVCKVEIYVTNTEGGKSEAATSNTLSRLQLPITSITATSYNKPLAGDSPNSKGVYPVHVSWTTEATGAQTITRVGSDGTKTTFSASGSFDDTTTAPLVIYDYYIDTSDELGRTLGEIKHATNSYAAVTPQVFIDIFESAGLKPWEKQSYVPDEYKSYWKSSKIATLVGYGNASDLSTQMKALDSASDNDHYRGGKITYNASTEGIGGQIYFTYSNFGESSQFYITGNYEMHVDSSGTGSTKSTTGGFTVNGMYKGLVSLDKMSVKNKAFSGTYVISLYYSDGTVGGLEVGAK